MGFDFFGYDMNVAIFKPGESAAVVGVVPATSQAILQNIGSGVAESQFDPVGLMFRDVMTELTVTVNMGGLPTIEVVLQPPYEVAMKIVNSDLLNVGNGLAVKFGYPSSPAQITPWVAGIMLAPEVSFGVPMTISLKAQGMFLGGPRTQPSYRWDNVSRLLAVESVLEPYGLKVVVDGTLAKAIRDVDGLSASRAITGQHSSALTLEEKRERIFLAEKQLEAANRLPAARLLTELYSVDQNEDDFSFVDRLLREAGVVYRWDNDKLHLSILSAKFSETPVVGFRWYGETINVPDFQSGGAVGPTDRLPVISYTVNTSMAFYGGAAQEMVCEGVSYDTLKWKDRNFQIRDNAVSNKQASSGDYPSDSPMTPNIVNAVKTRGIISESPGSLKPIEKKIVLGHIGAVKPFPALDQAKNAVAERVLKPDVDKPGQMELVHDQMTMTTYSNQTATLETIGIPSIVPMDIISLEGVGRFGGNYLVSQIVHKLGSSGFHSSLSLLRPGTDNKSGVSKPSNIPLPSRPLGGIETQPLSTSIIPS